MRTKKNILKNLYDKEPQYQYRANSKFWKRIDAYDAAVNFPTLSEENVRQLTFGTYHIC